MIRLTRLPLVRFFPPILSICHPVIRLPSYPVTRLPGTNPGSSPGLRGFLLLRLSRPPTLCFAICQKKGEPTTCQLQRQTGVVMMTADITPAMASTPSSSSASSALSFTKGMLLFRELEYFTKHFGVFRLHATMCGSFFGIFLCAYNEYIHIHVVL